MSTHGSGNSSYSGEVFPTSQYLQDKLQEQRARSTRPKRARHTDLGPQRGRDDDIFLNEAESGQSTRAFESSPITATVKTSRTGSDSRRRALGVRDIDQQLDRLSKQNFALKLELDHRRDQTAKLQEQIETMRAQVERAEALEDEHKELLNINSQIVEELEQRDKAVEEAVAAICELEDRIAYLEPKHNNTRPSTATNPDSGYAGTEATDHELPTPPQQIARTSQAAARRPSVETTAASQKLQSLLAQSTPAKPRREPAILSAKKTSTNALRSVYMANSKELRPVRSFQSMLSRQGLKPEEDAEDVPNSPRLSTLSESSFPSIYESQKHPERYEWEDRRDDIGTASPLGPRSHLRQDSINRVSQWIEEGDAVQCTPSKGNSFSTPLATELEQRTATPGGQDSAQTHYPSLNNTLAAATVQSLESTALSGHVVTAVTAEARLRNQVLSSRQPRPNSIAGPIFGEPLLPPTPDSASTHMLRASRSSITEDQDGYADATALQNGHQQLSLPPREGGVRTAPRVMRSSVELSTAFQSNLQYRNAHLDGLRADGAYDASDADHGNDWSERMRNFGAKSQGYPDGGPIVMGTPSRFLKHAKSPVSDVMFTSADTSPPQRMRAPPRRRRSSDNFIGSSSEPRVDRAETSPLVTGLIVTAHRAAGKTSAESMVSPRSVHSGSSGERTIVQAEEQRSRATPPVGSNTNNRMSSSIISPARSRKSPSPGRTLGQRTAGLFGRLSASNGEASPLPTLTSTPSSAYAKTTPIELRRPRTSHADRSPPSIAAPSMRRPPSSRETRRPSLQLRTKTEPATARAPASATERATQSNDKRSLFRRSNSVKNNTGVPPSDAHIRGLIKRRGSIRDAVSTAAGRRPWRG